MIIIAVAAIALALSSSPANTQSDLTVYIDSVKQTGNYSQPQTYDWGSISTGYTYSRNFTVLNTGAQAYTITLLTSQPEGTSSVWSFNNSRLEPSTYAAASLTYTLSTSASTGTYTWRLLASNNTDPTPTPTPDPSATPTPNTLEFTIDADNGVATVTITRNSLAPFTLESTALPKTYLFTRGDDIKFTYTLGADYEFNGWDFNDGTMPLNTPVLQMPNMQGNFTVTATTKLMPTQ